MVEEVIDRSPLLKYTPVFTKFSEANEALMDCYQGVNMADYNSMGKAAQNMLCHKEKTTIKNILTNNEMNMTQVVTDRVAVLYALNKRGMKVVYDYQEN